MRRGADVALQRGCGWRVAAGAAARDTYQRDARLTRATRARRHG